MGVMTLAQFQNELHAVFGDRGAGNERLTLWLNLAYQEVCGEGDFEDLKCLQDFNTSEGVYKYETPDSFIKFISFFDVTNKARLLRIGQELIGLRDVTEDTWAQPLEWAIRENVIYLFPVPDDVYEMNGLFLKEPTPLAAPGDRTVIPPAWDLAILLRAQKIGWLAYGETQKANDLMRQAVANTSMKKSDNNRLNKTPQLGLQVAWSLEDLQDQE